MPARQCIQKVIGHNDLFRIYEVSLLIVGRRPASFLTNLGFEAQIQDPPNEKHFSPSACSIGYRQSFSKRECSFFQFASFNIEAERHTFADISASISRPSCHFDCKFIDFKWLSWLNRRCKISTCTLLFTGRRERERERGELGSFFHSAEVSFICLIRCFNGCVD